MLIRQLFYSLWTLRMPESKLLQHTVPSIVSHVIYLLKYLDCCLSGCALRCILIRTNDHFKVPQATVLETKQPPPIFKCDVGWTRKLHRCCNYHCNYWVCVHLHMCTYMLLLNPGDHTCACHTESPKWVTSANLIGNNTKGDSTLKNSYNFNHAKKIQTHKHQ